jgi:hypothetical protein
MEMAKAILRKDLIESGERPYYHPCNVKVEDSFWEKSAECWQPKIYEDNEFNLCLASPNGVIRVMSIDFEFQD